MRHITIPQDITLSERPKVPMSFRELVLDVWTVDAKFGKDFRSVLIAAGIRERVIKAMPGETIQLEDKEWELLCDVVREPTSGYNPKIMVSLVPFCTTVLEAAEPPK